MMAAAATDKNADFTPLALFNYFINKCRENLHIVIAFSPIGDAFRNRYDAQDSRGLYVLRTKICPFSTGILLDRPTYPTVNPFCSTNKYKFSLKFAVLLSSVE